MEGNCVHKVQVVCTLVHSGSTASNLLEPSLNHFSAALARRVGVFHTVEVRSGQVWYAMILNALHAVQVHFGM